MAYLAQSPARAHSPMAAQCITRLFVVVAAIVTVRAAGGAETLAEFRISDGDDLLIVPVTFGEQCFRFYVDTGCVRTICDESLVPLLGSPIGTSGILTPNGRTATNVFASPQARVGPLSFPPEARILTADFTSIRRASGHDIRGALGMDFLVNYIIDLDFDRGRLRFLGSLGRHVGTGVPLARREDGLRSISASIAGLGPINFVVDTGYAGPSTGGITPDIFDTLQTRGKLISLGPSPLATLKSISFNEFGKAASFSLAGYENHAVIFDKLDDDNLLGLAYLSRFHVTLDFPHGTMYLARGRGFNKDDRLDLSGLHVWKIDGQVIVQSVDQRSPAAAVGIAPGDALIELDGRALEARALIPLRRQLSEVGRRLDFLIRRDGRELRVSITLRDWRGGTSQRGLTVRTPAKPDRKRGPRAAAQSR